MSAFFLKGSAQPYQVGSMDCPSYGLVYFFCTMQKILQLMPGKQHLTCVKSRFKFLRLNYYRRNFFVTDSQRVTMISNWLLCPSYSKCRFLSLAWTFRLYSFKVRVCLHIRTFNMFVIIDIRFIPLKIMTQLATTSFTEGNLAICKRWLKCRFIEIKEVNQNFSRMMHIRLKIQHFLPK